MGWRGMQRLQVRGHFQSVGKRRSPAFGRRHERLGVRTIVVDRVANAHLMPGFSTELKWQHSRDSIFDAKSSLANGAAQNGVQNSPGVASRFLRDGQLTIVHVAPKQKDHISGEVM